MGNDVTDEALASARAAWVESGLGAAALAHVTIVPDRTATGENTRVQIDHVIPDPAAGTGAPARWRVTTKPQFLSRHRFHADTIARMRQADQPVAKGRVVYCVPAGSGGEVTAAVSFHLPMKRSLPVQITAIAVLQDGDDEQVAQSFVCAWIAKQYVHAAASKLGRESFVDIDIAPAHLASVRLLGFRPAPRVRGFQPSAEHLRQHVQ